jgi:hypothetical protein
MMAAYLEAALPTPFVVLGKTLKPYTLGHELLLRRFDSGFAFESNKPATVEDLIFSVLVCSRTYPDALRLVEECLSKFTLRLWGYYCRDLNICLESQRFHAYVAEATRIPGMDWKEGIESGGAIGSPWHQLLKITLMDKFGWTEMEALSTPYAKAIWDYCSIQEAAGRIRIQTDQDRQDYEEAKAFCQGMMEVAHVS